MSLHDALSNKSGLESNSEILQAGAYMNSKLVRVHIDKKWYILSQIAWVLTHG